MYSVTGLMHERGLHLFLFILSGSAEQPCMDYILKALYAVFGYTLYLYFILFSPLFTASPRKRMLCWSSEMLEKGEEVRGQRN